MRPDGREGWDLQRFITNIGPETLYLGKTRAASLYSSPSPGMRRRRFVAALRRLASSRAAFDARLGLVAFRFFRTASASAITDSRRSVTSSRLRSWLLVALETSLRRPL